MEEFDFVVGSFEGAGRDGVVILIEDAFAVGSERACELQELFDAARFGIRDPVIEEDAAGDFARLLPDLGEVLLEVVGRGQRLVELESFLQSLAVATFRVEVFGTF